MLIKVKCGWEIPEGQATPESVFLNRRSLLRAMGMGSLLAAGATALPLSQARSEGETVDPTAGLYPFRRDNKYKLDRPITPERDATHYNNFYEYGESKYIASAAQELKIRPWTVTFDGMVEKPMTMGIDDLIRRMPREERLYRFRCVEAWSMAVPWDGFALKALVDLARPLSSATYLKMTTFMDPGMAPGQKVFWYPWPYTEGLTMAEATNQLSFLVTGMYGHPLPKQDGAPLRLAVPWKYGFKSIKSIVRFTFTDKRPETFWHKLDPNEYGFWANVNPAVPHPRWSQATERELGMDKRVPTLIWNGYGEYVAAMYKDIKGQQLFR